MKYRKNQDLGLFDKENTLRELLENGNPLPKLKEIIDFEQFRSILEDRISNDYPPVKNMANNLLSNEKIVVTLH